MPVQDPYYASSGPDPHGFPVGQGEYEELTEDELNQLQIEQVFLFFNVIFYFTFARVSRKF